MEFIPYQFHTVCAKKKKKKKRGLFVNSEKQVCRDLEEE